MRKRLFTAITLLSCITTVFAQQAQSMSDKIISIAIKYLDTPYVAHTLEEGDKEELIINTDEVDCTTFLEYVVAEACAPTTAVGINEDDFDKTVRKLRYKDGSIKDYSSRNHYFTEWINNNINNGTIEDITAQNVSTQQTVNVNYMSQHPDLYKRLKGNKAMQQKIRQNEEAINGQQFAYLPKAKLKHQGLKWIHNGDLIAIVTNRQGLDIAHVGFAFYAEDHLCFLHASSTQKKVVVSTISLAQMLKENSTWVGIRVLRVNG